MRIAVGAGDVRREAARRRLDLGRRRPRHERIVWTGPGPDRQSAHDRGVRIMTSYRVGRRTVEITHPERVLFPADGITKGDLADYHHAVADVMVPHLADRPLMLQRFPEGIGADGFYQKEAGRGVAGWIPHRSRCARRAARSATRRRRRGRPARPDQPQHGHVPPLAEPGRPPRAPRPPRHRPRPVDRRLRRRPSAPPTGRASCSTSSTSPPTSRSPARGGLHVVTPLDRSADDRARSATFADGLARVLAARHPDELTVEFHKADARRPAVPRHRPQRLGPDGRRAVLGAGPPGARRWPRRWSGTSWTSPDLRPDGWTIATVPDRVAERRRPVVGDGPPRPGARPPPRPPRRAARRSRADAQRASWKTRPSVWRRPDRTMLTPWRIGAADQPAGRAHRAVAGREHQRLALPDDGRRRPGLRPRPLLDDDELAAGVVVAGRVEADDDLQREHELAVEVAVQRVPVAGPVAQQQRRRAPWPAAWQRSSHSSRSSGHGAGRPRRSAQSRAIGSRWGQNAARSCCDERRAAGGRSSGTRPRRSGGGPCRPSSGSGGRRRRGRPASRHSSASRTVPATAQPTSSSSAATAGQSSVDGRRLTPPPAPAAAAWPRRRRGTGRWCRRCARRGGTARRAGPGCGRTPCRPPARPAGCPVATATAA